MKNSINLVFSRNFNPGNTERHTSYLMLSCPETRITWREHWYPCLSRMLNKLLKQ